MTIAYPSDPSKYVCKERRRDGRGRGETERGRGEVAKGAKGERKERGEDMREGGGTKVYL